MNGEVEEERQPDVVEDNQDDGADVEDNQDDDADVEDFGEQTIVIETEDDEIRAGDMSAEIRVEELVAKIDADKGQDAEKQRKIKKQLEEAEEKIGKDLDGTYNFDLDDV